MPLGLLPEERQALLDINFLERYENFCLSRQYSVEETEPFGKSIKPEVVKELIASLGYKVTYNKRERFFKIKIDEDKDLGLSSIMHIVVPFGYASVELMWYVSKDKKPYAGSVLFMLVANMTNPREKPPFPVYPDIRSYDELREVLEENIALFKDFIDALKKYQ